MAVSYRRCGAGEGDVAGPWSALRCSGLPLDLRSCFPIWFSRLELDTQNNFGTIGVSYFLMD